MLKTTSKTKKASKSDNASLETKVAYYEKKIFDLEQLLEISKALNSQIGFAKLIDSILYTIMAQMSTPDVAVFTRNSFDDDDFVLNRCYYGFGFAIDERYVINMSHPFLQYLDISTETYFDVEEIREKFGEDEKIARLLDLEPSLFVPLKAKNKLEGFLIIGKRYISNTYIDHEYEMLVGIATFAGIAINNSQLLEMSTTDLMTHLKQKHYFFTVLQEKIESLRKSEHLSVLMIDIDFFKKINDTYGHDGGDVILTSVAHMIKSCVRNSDVVARYGGEEFVIALFGMGIEGAKHVADRILKKIQETPTKYGDIEITVTVSIGIASYLQKTDDAKSITKRADKAMYVSKQKGRNQVNIAEENIS
ncbi:MAG: diguanylate cyclase DgcA [Treponema sp.]